MSEILDVLKYYEHEQCERILCYYCYIMFFLGKCIRFHILIIRNRRHFHHIIKVIKKNLTFISSFSYKLDYNIF